ncbi:MAG: hypothetical protein CK424_05425 [Legionella sp.]|nr:MAG: hypothetical protein CK424_05425 [Legionella sp.]
MKKITLGLGLCLLHCAASAVAGTMGEASTLSPFYVGAFGGYGKINGAIKDDGNFAQGRLAIGARAREPFQHMLLGGELGIQTGNTMRLSSSDTVLDLSGNLPFQSTLKPVLDALVTLKFQVQPESPFAVILKGGIAFRQLQLNDRTSISDSVSTVNGEFQAGLGYRITERMQLTAMYQGIYSNNNANVQFTSVAADDFFDIGYTTISRIPTQQAGFLGIEYTF